MNLFRLFLENLDDAIENKTGRNTIRDAIAKRHENPREKRRNRIAHLCTFDLLESGKHHNTDDNKRRRGCRIRDRTDKRCKKRADRKANRHNHTRQTGTSACTDTGSAFNYEVSKIFPNEQS